MLNDSFDDDADDYDDGGDGDGSGDDDEGDDDNDDDDGDDDDDDPFKTWRMQAEEHLISLPTAQNEAFRGVGHGIALYTNPC